MLILTRRRNESVILTTSAGEVITVTIAGVDGDKVRVGFDAPREVEIKRREIWDGAKKENTGGR